MSHQNIKSDLLVDLSADQQQLLSGGQRYSSKPIICYTYAPYDSSQTPYQPPYDSSQPPYQPPYDSYQPPYRPPYQRNYR